MAVGKDICQPVGGGPVSALRRAWRRGGFGVHSPFAFSFLQSVVRGYGSRYGYYAYDELDRMAAASGMPARTMRMAYRAALFFRDCRLEILATPEHREALERMMETYAGRVRGCAGDGRGRVIIALDEAVGSAGLVSELASESCGITFRGRSVLIHAGLEHLPRLTYDVWM